MSFTSILFQTPEEASAPEHTAPPDFFPDLLFDQIVQSVTSQAAEYDLNPFYYRQLSTADAIIYRQEIMRDLSDAPMREAIESFAESMRSVRERLKQSEKVNDYKLAQQRCFLGAVCIYCGGITALATTLPRLRPQSRGFRAFIEYLQGYVGSTQFRDLSATSETIKAGLASVDYSLLLRTGSIAVRKKDTSEDYSIAVEKTFEKFRNSSTVHYWLETKKWGGMNHIEAAIQNRVALLYPDIFGVLETFCAAHTSFLDPTVTRFDREVQFYVTYLAYTEGFLRQGLTFSQPKILTTSKEVCGTGVFDLALAGKLIGSHLPVVTNDLFLNDPERILVVSGPNQSGKTTFARTIGQLHYLAALGCTVPGTNVSLFLFDQIYTHFAREEDVRSLRGRLQDDLVRMSQILARATPRSLIILNEIFASTTVKDALYLAKGVIGKISELDSLTVCVTFLEELARFNQKTASFVSMVDPADPAHRTFKLERRPANGLAYAMSLAQKYRITYEALKERIPQ